jgi:hypothetical protein
MNILLWVLQVALAFMFAAHGYIFVLPPAEMVADMDATFAPAVRIFIGIAEWLGALGLILPGLTRIMPGLTVAAATGLALVTASATVFHLTRGEPAIVTAVLCLLAAFVAYMRWKVKPILPRAETSASQV